MKPMSLWRTLAAGAEVIIIVKTKVAAAGQILHLNTGVGKASFNHGADLVGGNHGTGSWWDG